MEPPGRQGTGRDRNREEQGNVKKRGTSLVGEDSSDSSGSSRSDDEDKTDRKERGRGRESTSQSDNFFDDLFQGNMEKEENRLQARREGRRVEDLKGQPQRIMEADKTLQRAMQKKEDENKRLKTQAANRNDVHKHEMEVALKRERDRTDRRIAKLERDVATLFTRTQEMLTIGSTPRGAGITFHEDRTGDPPIRRTTLTEAGEKAELEAEEPEGNPEEKKEEEEDHQPEKKKRKKKGEGKDGPTAHPKEPPDDGGGTGGGGPPAPGAVGGRKRVRETETTEHAAADRPRRTTAGHNRSRDIGDTDSGDDNWRENTEMWIRDKNGMEQEKNGKMAGWPEFLRIRGVQSLNLEGLSKRDKVSWRKRFIRNQYKLGKRTPQIKAAVNAVKRAFRKQGWHKDRDLWDDPGVREAVAATRYSLEEYKEALRTKARNEKYPMHLEGLAEMHDRLKPYDVEWHQPYREEVDRAIMFLLAVLLFDIGMRIGTATLKKVRNLGKPNTAAWKPPPAKIPGRNESEVATPNQDEEESGANQRREDGEPDGGEDQGEESDSEDETETTEKNDPIMSHTFVLEDLEFAVLDELGSTQMRRGGRSFVKELRTRSNDWVIWCRVTFDTSKTTNLQKRPKLPRPAVMGRRSPIESRALDLLLDFLRWRGPVPPRTPLLARPPVRGRNKYMGGWKTVGATELVKGLKEMARRHNVQDSHVSAISFRKGHVTTVLLLTMKERKDGEIGMQAAIDRAGKWAQGSGVPRKHYLAAWDDRGPLALIHSWAEGIPIGGGFEGWRIRQPA